MRLLYENNLADEKWKYIITVDEAWICLSYCNRKRLIYSRKRGEKDLTFWFSENKEAFAKGFPIILDSHITENLKYFPIH